MVNAHIKRYLALIIKKMQVNPYYDTTELSEFYRVIADNEKCWSGCKITVTSYMYGELLQKAQLL